MSGAFVNEDATHEPEPRYALPSREGLGDERMGRLGRRYLRAASR